MTNLDSQIENSYYRQCNSRPIDIMDIGKLFQEARQSVEAGKNLDEAVEEAIVKYDKS